MATAQPRNKRTRVDDTSHTKSSSPTAAAKNVVTTYCESLQPSLQDLLIDSAVKNFLQQMEISNRKTRAVTKMETTADYIPRSLKLNCTLYCTQLAQQEAEYNTLAEFLKQCVTTFQNSAKACVINATKLDATVHKNAAKKSLCEGLYNIVSAYITLNGHNTNQIHKFANTIMERQHHDSITPIFALEDFSTLVQVQSCYVTFTTAATEPLPVPFLNPDAHLAHNPPAVANAGANAPIPNPYNDHNNVANIDAATRKNEATISQIWCCIKTCYLDSWTAYLRQQEANDTALRLKKLSTDLLTRTATEATQMQLDQEPAADPQLLQALIAQSVAQETAALRATVQTLQSQIKNMNARSQRGASRNQANPGRGRGNPRQQRAAPEADAPADASTARNRNNSSNQSNRRSGGRNSNSNRRGNRQQRRSGNGQR